MIKPELLDMLLNALETETVLRKQAAVEMANGINNGPMRIAHSAAIGNVIGIAKLIE